MMGLMCAIGCHEAAPREVYNCGYHFSRCRRCGRDMIRAGAAWSLVPQGHRVVWKAGRQSHSVEPDYRHALPVLLRTARLPTAKPALISWSRAVQRRPKRSMARNVAIVEAQMPEAQYPVLLIVATMVGAGLQLLLGLRGDG
ncbi:MAG: hypothetical protein JO013_14525 [Alphaproteobacteria bacterium]|nr:hypothetical protein [Alphaproteobacteria bacterium]